jgi:uncharacterized membrane protein
MIPKTNKSPNTNMVAIFGAIIVIVALVLVFLDKATLTEASTFVGGLGMILTIINSYLSKDKNASHTVRQTLDPDKDDYPKDKF